MIMLLLSSNTNTTCRVHPGVPCSPSPDCTGDAPMRCKDWTCAADASACKASTTNCAAGEIRCPDGLCYTGSNMGDCVKKGVQWEGCPPEQIECSGKKGVCAATTDECAAKVGCVPPKKNCGILRDEATGKPVFTDANKPQFICEETCTRGNPQRAPEHKLAKMDPSTEGAKIDAMDSSGNIAMRLKTLKKNAFKTSAGTAVNFTVAPVPDSLVHHGAFANFFNRSSLVSALIQIEPDAEIDIVEGGLQLEIPVASASAEMCDKVLANLQVLTVSDVTDLSESPSLVGNCTKGDADTCSCAVMVSHFSTFGVVDTAVASQAASANIATTTFDSAASAPGTASWLLLATCLAAMAPITAGPQ